MAKRAVLHLRKGSTWLLNRGGKQRRSSVVFVADQYRAEPAESVGAGPEAGAGGLHYGIDLHSYPLEIVDYLGHYFLPVEKAA